MIPRWSGLHGNTAFYLFAVPFAALAGGEPKVETA